MALVEGCRHTLEITVPADELQEETTRALQDVQKKARLPGFRPGKAPASLLRRHFEGDIRERILNSVIPKYLQQQVERENLHLAGRPEITDVHFHEGEPLRFKAEFEVVPDIELQEYRNLEVEYHDPEVTAEDVEKRVEELREQKAEFVNLDPRPVEDGDFAVVSLESTAGVEGEPVKQDEMVLHIGDPDTLPAFTENLRGLSPGDEKEFDVEYPEDYGSERLAGKTVRFLVRVKGLRRKELPELNDEFAAEVGDYRTVDELRDAVRKSTLGQRQNDAQRDAKDKLVEKLVDMHEFPVPEAFVERQVRNRAEQFVRQLALSGADLSKVNIDWEKFRTEHRERAVREVKASLLLSRIAEREAIEVTEHEVTREVERIARAGREAYAAVRVRMEKDGSIGRVVDHIRTDKILNFLFEGARKVA